MVYPCKSTAHCGHGHRKARDLCLGLHRSVQPWIPAFAGMTVSGVTEKTMAGVAEKTKIGREKKDGRGVTIYVAKSHIIFEVILCLTTPIPPTLLFKRSWTG